MSLIRTLMFACLIVFGPVAHAQALTSKGVATVAFDGKLNAAVKDRALQEAKINALDRYFAQTDGAKSRNFETARAGLIGSIDNYVLSATVLSEEADPKAGRYTVSIRAEINGPRLENALIGGSAIASTPTAQKSLLTFVFVARQQGSVQSFDDKVYKRVDANVSGSANADYQRDATESERITNNSISTSDKVSARGNYKEDVSASVTTGGSTTAKADVVSWTVTRADEINSVMTGSFTAAGYEVVEAEYVGQLDVRGDPQGLRHRRGPQPRRFAERRARCPVGRRLSLLRDRPTRRRHARQGSRHRPHAGLRDCVRQGAGCGGLVPADSLVGRT